MVYTTNEILLDVKGINKSYDKPVLRDINLQVYNLVRPDLQQGQIVSLVGKSGSGKSTLFEILAGLGKPDSGTVLVNKEQIPAKRGDMGVVFQNSFIFPWRKVGDILYRSTLKNIQILKGDRGAAVADMANKLDILALLGKYSNQLSGGQRQRVAIAEQILNGGNFILFDEPFSGLDTLSIDKVTQILTDLVANDEYKTLVIVSHDLSNCLAISDTAFILANDGQQEGSTITGKMCLAEMDLAWHPDIKENPIFRDLLKHVKELL